MPPVTARIWRSLVVHSGAAATTPPMASPCPPRNLVALCSTMAAPCRKGCWRTGLAKVLSTSSGTPSAAAATRAMSTSSRLGLAGVSRITRPVSGRSAAWTPSGVVNVTSLPSTPEASR